MFLYIYRMSYIVYIRMEKSGVVVSTIYYLLSSDGGCPTVGAGDGGELDKSTSIPFTPRGTLFYMDQKQSHK